MEKTLTHSRGMKSKLAILLEIPVSFAAILLATRGNRDKIPTAAWSASKYLWRKNLS
jgi:hypothetical protein